MYVYVCTCTQASSYHSNTYLCKENDSLEFVRYGEIKVENEESSYYCPDAHTEKQKDTTRIAVVAAKPQVKTRPIALQTFTTQPPCREQSRKEVGII